MYLLPIKGVIGEDFTHQDLLMHLNAAKNEQTIKLLVGSPGGYTDEAKKMEESLVKSGKTFFSENIGDVASAAVQLFLLPPKENRLFDPAKGVFMIHMPFIDPEDGGATGTANEIEQVAVGMKALEKEMIKKYSKATGTDEKILEGFMNENQPLTSEQVSQLNFANIKQQEFKAVAFYKHKNEKMSKEFEEKVSGLEKLLKKVLAFVSPKALMLQDVNGNELDFGAEVQDASQITVGTTATVNGTAANGDYVMADGSVLVFENGAISDIKPNQEDEMTALKNENETLRQEIEAMKAEKETIVSENEAFKNEAEEFKTKAEKEIKEISEEFTKFKAQFSKGDESNHANTSGGNSNTGSRRPFKVKS